MQYVYIGLAVFTLIGDSLKGLFKSKEVKVIAIVIALYFTYQILQRKERQEKARKNLMNDPAGSYAALIYNALNPYFVFKYPILGKLPNGTDEQEIINLFFEIGQKNLYADVAKAFKDLYSEDLADELRSDGVFNEAMEAYRQGQGNTTGSTTTNSTKPVRLATTTARNNKNLLLKTGGRYVINGAWNLRNADNYTKVEGTTEAGQVYHINYFVNYKVNGQTLIGANVSRVILGISLGIFTDKIIALDGFTQAN